MSRLALRLLVFLTTFISLYFFFLKCLVLYLCVIKDTIQRKWLVGWLIGWLVVFLIDWLIGWLTDQSINRLIDLKGAPIHTVEETHFSQHLILSIMAQSSLPQKRVERRVKAHSMEDVTLISVWYVMFVTALLPQSTTSKPTSSIPSQLRAAGYSCESVICLRMDSLNYNWKMPTSIISTKLAGGVLPRYCPVSHDWSLGLPDGLVHTYNLPLSISFAVISMF